MKKIIKWVLIGFAGLVLLGLLLPEGPPSDTEENTPPERAVTEIVTLEDLEASAFFNKYEIAKGSSWDLKAGGVNNTYDISGFEDLIFEVQTEKGKITGYGFSFPAYTELGESEYRLMEDLLVTLGQDDTDSAMDFIKENAEIPVKDDHTNVFGTEPFAWGDFEIFARKVGGPIIAIERL